MNDSLVLNAGDLNTTQKDSSLVFKSSMEMLYGPKEGSVSCQRPRKYWVKEWHQLKRSSCCTSGCLSCNRRRSWNASEAIAIAKPQVLFTLTGFLSDKDEITNSMRLTLRSLRNQAPDIGLIWAAERNPASDGVHIHGYAHTHSSLPLTQSVFELAMPHQGLVDVKKITYHGWLPYIIKATTHNQDSLEDHLLLNGKKMVRGTGFWRDWYGQPLTMSEAMRLGRWQKEKRSTSQGAGKTLGFAQATKTDFPTYSPGF
jgi:hypothetical protein